MPVSEPGLPVNRMAVEQAQMDRSIARMQERAANPAPPGRPEGRDREGVTELVRRTGEARAIALLGGNRRPPAPSALRREVEKEKPEPAGEKPPDPGGRGRHLDVRV